MLTASGGDSMSTQNEIRPSLCWELGDDTYEMQFGYMHGEPTAALFVNDSTTPMFIPQEILDIALYQGWAE